MFQPSSRPDAESHAASGFDAVIQARKRDGDSDGLLTLKWKKK